jgi:hypothetical protein
MAVVFGILGKTPGSEGFAWTGILCGGAACVVAVIMLAVGIFALGMDLLR